MMLAGAHRCAPNVNKIYLCKKTSYNSIIKLHTNEECCMCKITFSCKVQ